MDSSADSDQQILYPNGYQIILILMVGYMKYDLAILSYPTLNMTLRFPATPIWQ